MFLIVSHGSLSVYKAPLVFDNFDGLLGSECSMKIQQLHMVNNQISKERIAIREWQTRITNMREYIGAL